MIKIQQMVYQMQHAFAVGQATGVNINGSHMGAVGAALHNDSSMHKNNNDNSNNIFDNNYKTDNQNYNKHNTHLVGIITFIVIIVISSVFIYVYSNNNSNTSKIYNDEKLVSNKDYLYEKGIEYLKSKYHDLNTRKEQEDYQVLISYKKFGVTDKDNYNYVYTWVLSESYFVKNDQLHNGRSNSSLYKIAFLNDEVISYEMPLDGKDNENVENYIMDKNYSLVKNDNQSSDFSISLKGLCHNKKVYHNIMNYEVNLSNTELIKEHYSYLKDLTVSQEQLNNDSSRDESVPFPADEAHGGSGNVYREW